MECDVLGSSNMQETLANSGEQLNTATRNIYMSLAAASCKRTQLLINYPSLLFLLKHLKHLIETE